MIYYKGMNLYTIQECLEVMGITNLDDRIHMIGDLYLDPKTPLDKIIAAVNLGDKGSFDYAVPQNWFDQHADEWKDDPYRRAIWFYPREGEGCLLGRPLRIFDLLGMLQKQIAKEAFDLWIKTNTEKGL